MTVIEKLSDRGGFVFEAIRLILYNKGTMKTPKLQWELFERGVFVKEALLKQAISVMKENRMLKLEEKESKSVSDGVFQKESQA